MVLSDDISVITAHSDFYDASNTLLYSSTQYYHIPVFIYFIIFTLMIFLFGRLSIELIKRLSKRSKMFTPKEY